MSLSYLINDTEQFHPAQMIIPLYQAEMAPPSVRGRLVSLNQLLIVTGVASSFWIDYATQVTIPHSSWVFRHPLLAQCYVAGILLAGMLFMPESVRWLLKRDQREQALKNLAFIRQLPADNPYVKYEFEEIETVIGEEKKLPSGRWLELFGPEMRRRVLVGVFLQLFQQLGGTNATTYYATTFCKTLIISKTSPNGTSFCANSHSPFLPRTTDGLLGFADPNMKLLLQGFYGVVKIVLTIPALIWLDKWGRRKFLMIGGIGMALNQLALGIMIRVVAGDCHSDACTKAAFANHPALGPLGVFFLWFYISWYAWSWGPIREYFLMLLGALVGKARQTGVGLAFHFPISTWKKRNLGTTTDQYITNCPRFTAWVYIAEIYPLRHRAKAMALAAAFDWLGNFTVGQLVPNWISRNNYGPFFFFFSTCTFMVIATYLWVPETKDVALEEMDALFEGGVKGRRESEDEAEGGRNVMVEDLVVKAK